MSAYLQFGRKTLALGGLLLMVACVLAAEPPPQLPSPIPAGSARVVSLSGQVSLRREREMWAVQASDVIPAGEEIMTGPDGHAILELDDGSRFEVFPSSRAIFRANRGNWRDLLDVFLGKVKIHIQKFGGRPNPYRINSPTALIAVRGTAFEVEVEPNEATLISVQEGLVAVSHRRLPGKEVLVKPGESLRVLANEPLTTAGVNKMQILGRVLEVALDRAVAVARGGAGVPGGKTPAPGGKPPSGQAPPPGGRPGGEPPDDDKPPPP